MSAFIVTGISYCKNSATTNEHGYEMQQE